ncbi:MAG: tryptophan 2,3-dioxygenase [Deltaproteobacteria bacterium]|nr:tryptophan 2,3-dioxygenase [Deltaproteobacteria bacterium]
MQATYWDYLKLDGLLSLQDGLEGTGDVALTDELHFIVVHQVYELWFKLILRSLRDARDALAAPRVAEESIPSVVHHIRRVTAILRLGVQHWDVVETLAPQDFLAFRDKLSPASGFQSFQMREFEILMGMDEADRIQYGKVAPLEHLLDPKHAATPGGRLVHERITAARAEGSLLGALNEWLYRTPIQGSTPNDPADARTVARWVDEYLERHEGHLSEGFDKLAAAMGPNVDVTARFQDVKTAARAFLAGEGVAPEERPRVIRVRAAALFIESYRSLPLLAWPRLLIDLIVEMEGSVVLWRHRHARMVERVIGRRVGTGGSGGVDYLDKTASYRIFRDLWAVRTVLLPRERLPKLANPGLYGFSAD